NEPQQTGHAKGDSSCVSASSRVRRLSSRSFTGSSDPMRGEEGLMRTEETKRPEDSPPPVPPSPSLTRGQKAFQLLDALFFAGVLMSVPGTVLWWFRNHTTAPASVAFLSAGGAVGLLWGGYMGLRQLGQPGWGWRVSLLCPLAAALVVAVIGVVIGLA